MNHKKIAIFAVLGIALLAGAGMAAWYLNRPLTTHGTIVLLHGIQVYSDAGCTNVLTDLDLGSMISPGDTVTKTFYVKNTGLNTVNLAYNFTDIPSFFAYTATRDTISLNPDTPFALASGQITTIVINFVVYASASLGDFAFTTNIYGAA